MFKQLKNGIIHGIGIILVLGIVGISYAAVSTVNSGTPLTAVKFNELINAINGTSGTWNAVLKGNTNPSTTDTNSINVSLNSTGNYYKIGKLVHVDIDFDVTANDNHVFYKIEGLPFSSSSNSDFVVGGLRGIYMRYGGSSVVNSLLSASIAGGTNTIYLQSSELGNAFTGFWYVFNGGAGSNNFRISGTYLTND